MLIIIFFDKILLSSTLFLFLKNIYDQNIFSKKFYREKKFLHDFGCEGTYVSIKRHSKNLSKVTQKKRLIYNEQCLVINKILVIKSHLKTTTTNLLKIF